MIVVKQVENDFVNQQTVITVETFQAVGSIRRQVDTFMIKVAGVYELKDDRLMEIIESKLAEIGYTITINEQPDGSIQSSIVDNSSGWVAPADGTVNPMTDPNVLPPSVVPTEEEALAVMDTDPNLVGNTPAT